MAVPPRATLEDDGDGEFTFPTPPPQLLAKGFHLGLPPCSASASSSPPVWLLSSTSPIRRSFSAADCAASPWRDRVLLARQRQHRRGLNGGCSPALSDYAGAGGGFCDEGDEEEEEGEEERMDSLWEDLNDDLDAEAARGEDLFFDVSRRRSVAGAGAGTDAAGRAWKVAKDGGVALAESRSSRRRPPGLVVMMRALKKMFVVHKGKSRVHRDEQQSTSSAFSFSRKG